MSSSGATYVNFSSLVTDVQSYIERGNSVSSDPSVFAQIPRLINAAERKLMQLLKLQGTIEVLNNPTGFTPGTSVIAKPDRWRQTVSFSYGGTSSGNSRTLLLPRSYEVCRNYWPDDSVQDPAQPPKYYSDYSYQFWLIAPTSPATFPIEVISYMQPQLLSQTNQNNFWTEYAPNALLYGTLMEATPFIKDDPRIATWQQYYSLELSSLDGQDMQKIMDRTADRKRP